MASHSAFAELSHMAEVLKQPGSNTLAYYVRAHEDCNFTREQLGEVVEGVFIESRIEPDAEGWVYASVYLDVKVNCTADSSMQIYSIDIRFGRVLPIPSIFYSEIGYSSQGENDSAGILSAVKAGVEEAVIDYL